MNLMESIAGIMLEKQQQAAELVDPNMNSASVDFDLIDLAGRLRLFRNLIAEGITTRHDGIKVNDSNYSQAFLSVDYENEFDPDVIYTFEGTHQIKDAGDTSDTGEGDEAKQNINQTKFVLKVRDKKLGGSPVVIKESDEPNSLFNILSKVDKQIGHLLSTTDIDTDIYADRKLDGIGILPEDVREQVKIDSTKSTKLDKQIGG